MLDKIPEGAEAYSPATSDYFKCYYKWDEGDDSVVYIFCAEDDGFEGEWGKWSISVLEGRNIIYLNKAETTIYNITQPLKDLPKELAGELFEHFRKGGKIEEESFGKFILCHGFEDNTQTYRAVPKKVTYEKVSFSTVGEAVQTIYDNSEDYYFINSASGKYEKSEFQDSAWHWQNNNIYRRVEIL